VGASRSNRAYSLPPVNFTVREAMVLSVLGRLATQLRLFPFTRTLNSALDKVRAALPTAQQRKLEASRERLTFVGVPAHDSVAAVRAAIEDAWFEEQPIHLRYERKDQSRGERTVQIEAIVLERTETLLNTVDVSTGERRQLKLHQILAATPPKEPAPTASPTTKGSAAPATRGKGSSRRGR
jgi:predicted DNA-binding transcriptional regulator YafY